MQQGSRFRTARGRAALATLLSLLLGVATAHAADAPPAPSSAAEQLAEQAYALHAQGKYAEAIATYLKAYEASSAAVTLFNIATIYDHKLHERELAAEYYRRFLRAPDAEPDLVEKATARLTGLKEESDAEARARIAPIAAAPIPAPSAARAPALAPNILEPVESGPAPGGRSQRIAGLVAGSIGLAGVGVSLALGALAKSKNDDANMQCDGPACRTEDGVMLAHEAGELAKASTVAFIGGLALLGSGVALVVLAPRGARGPLRVALGPVPGFGAGVRIGGGL